MFATFQSLNPFRYSLQKWENYLLWLLYVFIYLSNKYLPRKKK